MTKHAYFFNAQGLGIGAQPISFTESIAICDFKILSSDQLNTLRNSILADFKKHDTSILSCTITSLSYMGEVDET